jgi:hypothetical protein
MVLNSTNNNDYITMDQNRWNWFFPKWDSVKDLSTSSLLEAKTFRSNSTIELEIIVCLGFRVYMLAIIKIIFSTFSHYNATSQEKYHHEIGNFHIKMKFVSPRSFMSKYPHNIFLVSLIKHKFEQKINKLSP